MTPRIYVRIQSDCIANPLSASSTNKHGTQFEPQASTNADFAGQCRDMSGSFQLSPAPSTREASRDDSRAKAARHQSDHDSW